MIFLFNTYKSMIKRPKKSLGHTPYSHWHGVHFDNKNSFMIYIPSGFSMNMLMPITFIPRKYTRGPDP
jgi:hypothetical protein